MIIVDRKVKGIVPYRTIFFPTVDALREATERLAARWIARLFYSDTRAEVTRHVIRHLLTATTCIDLSRPLEAIYKGMEASTRNKVAKAEKLLTHVRIERNSYRARTDFLNLYRGLMEAKPGEVTLIDEGTLD